MGPAVLSTFCRKRSDPDDQQNRSTDPSNCAQFRDSHVDLGDADAAEHPSDRSQSEETEDLDDGDVFKDKLLDELDGLNMQAVGSIASSGQFAEAPSPGLFVKGAGPIGLPLSRTDAVAILDACQKSSCGQSLGLASNAAVPRSRELDTRSFELRNPRWKDFEDRVLSIVMKNLSIVGGTTGTRMQLRKLVIHEAGSPIQRYHDPSNSSGPVATVVTTLPSPHAGGDVVGTARGQTVTWKTAEDSDFGLTYFAHFQDVKLTTSVLNEGYRLALVYDLVSSSDVPQSASDIGLARRPVERLLKAWASEASPVFEKLVYMLDHRYTKANLETASLKGHDQTVARFLEATSKKHGITCFLANVDYTMEGISSEVDDYDCLDEFDPYGDIMGGDPDVGIRPEYEIEVVKSESFELATVVQPDGTPFAQAVPIDKDCILQEDPFVETMPYKEQDLGDGIEHTFRKSAVVLVITSRVVDFMVPCLDAVSSGGFSGDGSLNLLDWLQSLLCDYVEDRSFQCEVDLTRLCRVTIERNSRPSTVSSAKVRNDEMGTVVSAAFHLRNTDMLECALPLLDGLPQPYVFDEIGAYLPELAWSSWDKYMTQLIEKSASFHDCREAWNALLNRATSTAVESWTELPDIKSKARLHILAARNIPYFWGIDGRDLGEMYLQSRRDGLPVNDIVSLVKKHASKTKFYVAFLGTLTRMSFSGLDTTGTVDEIKGLMTLLATDFALQPREPRLRLTFPPSTPKEHSDTQFEEDLACVVAFCVLHDQVQEVVAIFDKTAAESDTVNLLNLDCQLTFVYDKVPKVLAPLERHNDIQVSLFRAARSVLSSYLKRVVQLRPSWPRDWSVPDIWCVHSDCVDCRTVSAFLRQPHQQYAEFPMTQNRCKHVQYGLRPERPLRGVSWVSAGVETRIDHQPRQFKLVVTKHLHEFEQSTKQWGNRVDLARKRFASLDIPTLKGALGEDYHEDVFGTNLAHSALEPDETAAEPPRLPLATVSSNVRRSPPGAGQEPPAKKPRVDVVDLTSGS